MRVGAIGFLNALPLTHDLPWPVEKGSPTEIQARLLAGELDLALCSVTTALCHESVWIVPAGGIGCRGAVDSVRLVFRDGIRDIRDCRRIALDPESNTANLLLQVILTCRYDRPPGSVEYVTPTQVSSSSPSVPPPSMPVRRVFGGGGGWGEGKVDASLLIGDRALLYNQPHRGGEGGAPTALPAGGATRAPEIDLGAAWTDWTGLPFVFAAWLSRTSTIADNVMDQLIAVRDRNLERLDELVTRFAPAPLRSRLAYLRERISYQLGPEELEGVRRFHGCLRELHLTALPNLPLISMAHNPGIASL
ncbi:MAG: menaquinone biosynthesis protein [Deltaproteobacteria bacterium]|nr:menaquinone biosynthesis protein [Deltaproteobacteria bacterium]